MKIQVLAIGQKMPDWVLQAVDEYTRRMPPHIRVEFREIAAEHRGKNADIKRIMEREGERLLEGIPRGGYVIALDRSGKQLATLEWAEQVKDWMSGGRDIAILIGGPDGLPDNILHKSDAVWSLSRLTFAHPLVRVLLAEQLYRAWSVTENHPYHR
jgi:23S rRNA (pseudouridine1915-N3)-methyltransferase